MNFNIDDAVAQRQEDIRKKHDPDYPTCFEHEHVWASFKTMAKDHPSNPCLQQKEAGTTKIWSFKDVVGNTEAIVQATNGCSAASQPVFVVFMERGPNAFHAMMSCYRVGGVYVPLPPSNTPVTRLVQVLTTISNNLNTPILCYSGKDEEDVISQASRQIGFHILKVDLDTNKHHMLLASEISGERKTSENRKIHPCYGLGCIIFTSGSTGVPKGVLLENKSIMRHFTAYWKAGEHLNVGDRVLAVTSLGFDMSLLEQLYASLQGCTVVFVPKRDLVTSLVDIIVAEKISMIFCTPSLLALSTSDPKECKTLKAIDMGGEAPTPDIIRTWSAPWRNIYNGYGPSEITIGCCHARLSFEDADKIHIGHGMFGYDMYIVNEKGELADEGELVVGGPCVSPGYLGEPEKTAKVFIDNPYNDKKGKLYRTGDNVKRRPGSGLLEFVGREDDQVKILGNRVELSEIEAQVSALPGVVRCCVPYDKTTHNLLCIVILEEGKDDGDITATDQKLVADLKSLLGEKVPPYMIPPFWFTSPTAFPITANGKTDKRKLMAKCNQIIKDASDDDGCKEGMTIEELLISTVDNLQSGVANPVKVTPDSDILNDFGFSSLQLVSVCNAVKKYNWRLTIAQLYQSSSLKELASTVTPIKKIDIDCKQSDPSKFRQTVVDKLTKDGLPVREYNDSQKPLSSSMLFIIETLFILAQYAIQLLSFTVSSFISLLSVYYLTKWNPGNIDKKEFDAMILVTICAISIVVGIVSGIVSMYIKLSIKLALGSIPVGVYSRHSPMFFKWMFLDHIGSDLAPGALHAHSWFGVRYYQNLGLKIAPSSSTAKLVLDFATCDHITIGERTLLLNECNLSTATVVGDTLIVGKIEIGDDCHVGANSTVELNSKICNGVRLGNNQICINGTTMESAPDYTPKLGQRVRPSGIRTVGQVILCQIAGLVDMFWGAMTFAVLYVFWNGPMSVFEAFVASVIVMKIVNKYFAGPLIAFVFLKVTMCMRGFKEGKTKMDSWRFVQFNTAYQHYNDNFPMHLDKGDLWFRFVYWFFGYNVGENSFIESTMSTPVPGLHKIGKGVLCGGNNSLNNLSFEDGYMIMTYLEIGDNSYIGNMITIAGAGPMPENTRVCTQADVGPNLVYPPLTDKTSPLVSGAPGVAISSSRSVTSEHVWWRRFIPPFCALIDFLLVSCIQMFVMILPAYILGSAVNGAFEDSYDKGQDILGLSPYEPVSVPQHAMQMRCSLLLFAYFLMVTFTGLVATLVYKWGLHGRMQPMKVHAASFTASLYADGGESVVGFQAAFCTKMMGTRYFNWFLKAMGIRKLGKDCMLNTPFVHDLDNLWIGNGVTCHQGTFCGHAMTPDYRYQVGHVKIGDRVSILDHLAGTYCWSSFADNTIVHAANALPNEAGPEGPIEVQGCPLKECARKTSYSFAHELTFKRPQSVCDNFGYNLTLVFGVVFAILSILVVCEYIIYYTAQYYYGHNGLYLVFMFMFLKQFS